MSESQRSCLIPIGVLILAVLFCGVIPMGVLPSLGLGVAMPVIQMPGEVLVGTEEAPVLTNTIVGTILADIVVLLVVFLVTRNFKEVPGRLQNMVEIIVETLYNLAKSIAGGRARWLLPAMATIFILILTANWLELVPGVDSVGLMHCAKPGMSGYPREGIALSVTAPLGMAAQTATEADYHACEAALHGATHEEDPADTHAAEDAGGEGHAEEGTPLYVVTPFVRAAATDLNFTLAIALVAVVIVQVMGVRSLKMSYFTKFLNLPALSKLSKNPVGAIHFAVGLIETISEFAKVISFAFRLFGNIFAGQVLLFVMAFLMAWFLPVIFYGLELFVGAIQAFVFAVLFLVFSASAMAGHGEEHH